MASRIHELKYYLKKNKLKFFVVSLLLKLVLVAIVFISAGEFEPSNLLRTRKDIDPSINFKEQVVKDSKKTITFDDYFNSKFSYRTFYPNWISDAEYVFRDSDNSLKLKNLNSQLESEILSSSAWESLTNPSSFSISPDRSFVIITSESTDGYAHYVRTFKWTFFDVSTGDSITIGSIPTEGIQKFKWSNAGHKLAYVQNFNLFMTKDLETYTSITDNGEEGKIFNGITDWLYVGEINEDDAVFWWSPNDDYIAFTTINEEEVREIEFSVYDKQYPTMVKLPYPKPSTPIPKISLNLKRVDDSTDKIQLDILSCIKNFTNFEKGVYLNMAVWRSETIFTAMFKNRYENEVKVLHYFTDSSDVTTCNSEPAVDHVSMEGGWLGHYKSHDIIPMTLNEFAWVNSNEGFPHLQVINWNSLTVDWRTDGEYEVTDVNSGYQAVHFYDNTNDYIYFTSTENENTTGKGVPRIRHLWRVKAHGDMKIRECITCKINIDHKDQCNWVNPSFSTNGKFVVINCGGTINGVPISVLLQKDATGNYIENSVLEDNSKLEVTLSEYNVRSVEFGSINLDDYEDKDEEFFYIMLKPPNFDKNKKYPLLVEVYSGPGYQRVYDRYSFSWKDYVASSLGVVVMSFDGRGTGFRGDKIMHQVYKKLGQFEPADQIEAARKIVDNFNFIDENKTAIWGWSYGGYTTTRTIEYDDHNVFKCGFAVAPVTDWKYYHTIYTERYMWQPDDNTDGYTSSTALQQAENIGKHRYAVLHGTRDENVHFQNSAQLEKYLVEADIDFSAYFFADNDHGMSNTINNYKTVYKTLTREMQFCFGQRSLFGDCCS